jgi:serine/threonine-protein kinase RsbW
MEVVFRICLPHDEASVPVVRHLVTAALSRLGVAEGCTSDVELAVTEACTNVLKHANGNQDNYEVVVRVLDTQCEIEVSDLGVGLPAGTLERPTAAPDEESGRGIQLMRALVDQLQFVARPGSGLSVNLFKRLALVDDAALRKLAGAAGPP